MIQSWTKAVGGAEHDATGKLNNQSHKQQQHQSLQGPNKHIVASAQSKAKPKNRDSLSERALAVKNTVDLI